MSIRVYLAGPEVFLPNAREQLDRKIALTRAAGLIPLAPGDIAVTPAETPRLTGHAISAIDEGLMEQADAIIANLTPYHGPSADVGTAFELGFMCAAGKLAYAYTNVAAPLAERLTAYYDGSVARTDDGRLRGTDGMSLEEFDMADNLMLHGGVERRGGQVVRHTASADALYTDTTAFEECLRLLAARA